MPVLNLRLWFNSLDEFAKFCALNCPDGKAVAFTDYTKGQTANGDEIYLMATFRGPLGCDYISCWRTLIGVNPTEAQMINALADTEKVLRAHKIAVTRGVWEIVT